ncbi:Neutral ceramidase [Halotydeus destructor]|nr:Neutral ceramidase [Halotydeus destructor]
MNLVLRLTCACVCLVIFPSDVRGQEVYQIGVGMADITGPAAEVGMMGYGKSGQETAGIHMRLFSRAFIVADPNGNRICFVNVDLAMVSQAVKTEVSTILDKKYGGLYGAENVLLSATHTHSGPGGFLTYVLYIITSQGFIKQNFDAIVTGIVWSVDRAHKMASETKGSIYYNEGDLFDANINRSPTAYLANPEKEREKYNSDTDKKMALLKFVSSDGRPLGVISWFAVHPTSMNNTNRIISGDNKGYASYMFESAMNPDYLPGKGPFVAAFANANLGDVSPNTMGPRCTDTGLSCDVATSTCGGQRQVVGKVPKANEKCHASGPGSNMFESTRIIGERQYMKAKELFDTAKTRVTGPVRFIHQHVDMSNIYLGKKTVGNRTVIMKTCKPAMGYSFAAGTTDGPGAFDFQQGATKSSPFWNVVRDFMKRPSAELRDCQHPKPILVATGEMKFPYLWQPTILPTQILKVGNIAMLGLPGEFTTMAGRRLREAVKAELDKISPGTKVLLTGLSNAYSSYVVTPEEYQVQRYEGASTIFGPYTLLAYIKQYTMLANHMANKIPLSSPGPSPPNLMSRQMSFKTGVVVDGLPFGKKFGDPVKTADITYPAGAQVYVSFIAGHPRNDLQTGKTFLAVDMKEGTKWVTVATDADWETRFYWHRTNSLFGESIATIIWDVPLDVKRGIYRIRHFGSSKSLLQQIKSYTAVSSEFQVI